MKNKKDILKVIDVWLKVENELLSTVEDGSWTHGRYYGAVFYLHKIKLLLGDQRSQKSLSNKTIPHFCEQCGKIDGIQKHSKDCPYLSDCID